MYEKQNFFSEHLATKLVNLHDKLNELIGFINTREQDRSEQMARMIDKVIKLENEFNVRNQVQKGFNNVFDSNLASIKKKIENAAQPKEEELLGCPWCLEKPILIFHPYFKIECENRECHIQPVTPECNTKQEAIETWNRRVK